jgi:predicted acyl esterase
MLWFAQRIAKGSYLRLILQGVNIPEMQKNWNSMRPVSRQSAADAQVATIRVLRESGHASRLVLPIGDAAAPCGSL